MNVANGAFSRIDGQMTFSQRCPQSPWKEKKGCHIFCCTGYESCMRPFFDRIVVTNILRDSGVLTCPRPDVPRMRR